MNDDVPTSNNSSLSWGRDITHPTAPSSSQITYVDLPCGSGKTHNLAEFFAETFRNSHFEVPAHLLYVGSSNDLIEEFSQRLCRLGVTDQRIITARHVGSDVVRQVTAHLSDRNVHRNSHVLLITHQTFLRLPASSHTRWKIFTDEIPQLDWFQHLNLPKSGAFLRGLLAAYPYTERLSLVGAKSPTQLRELLNSRDTGIEAMRDALEKILSRTHHVYTYSEAFDRFDGALTDDGQQIALPLLSVPNPSIFAGCCILGANFEQTMLFHYLKKNGRTPVRHAELTSRLRYSHYPSHVGSRTKIKYCLEHRRYSKTIRKEMTTEGITVQRALDEAISRHLGANRFLLMTNNDDQTDLLKSPNVVRLSGSPHGLNAYDQEHWFVFLSALLRTNVHEAMLVELGLSKTMIRHTTTIEAAHQAAMRTNLRIPTSNEPVHIIVPDRDTAEALGKILGCANISRLGNVEPQVKSRLDGLPHLTPSQKNKNSIAHKVEDSLLSRDLGNPVFDDSNEIQLNISRAPKRAEGERRLGRAKRGQGIGFHNSSSSRNSLPFLLNSTNGNDFWSEIEQPDDRGIDEFIHLLFHNSEKVANADQLRAKSFSPTSLRITFERLAKKAVRNKDDVILFNPCIFRVPDDGASPKQDKNFLIASCLVFDFDNGSFSPEDFIRLFWTQPGDHRKRSFMICNSFSRAPAKPNKFRVIIPFLRPVWSKEVFQAIHDQFVDRMMRGWILAGKLRIGRWMPKSISVLLRSLPQPPISRLRLLSFVRHGSKGVR